MLTQEELKEILDYYPETGIFRWKSNRANNKIKVVDIAGTLNYNGYRYIRMNGENYREHRLAWFYVYGHWPEKEIDHINGMKTDNSIENLREASRSENNMNKPKQINNTSGYKGVCWHKAAQKWQAHIKINKKLKHLGLFDSPEEAYAAYCEAAKRLHGEFANLN